MEKTQNLVAVPYASKWSNLGGWDAVWFESKPDASGNVTSETAHAIECVNSLLRSESSRQQVVSIGLDNVMAIAMPDAVLVADKERAQDVKKLCNCSSPNTFHKRKYFQNITAHGVGSRALS